MIAYHFTMSLILFLKNKTPKINSMKTKRNLNNNRKYALIIKKDNVYLGMNVNIVTILNKIVKFASFSSKKVDLVKNRKNVNFYMKLRKGIV